MRRDVFRCFFGVHSVGADLYFGGFFLELKRCCISRLVSPTAFDAVGKNLEMMAERVLAGASTGERIVRGAVLVVSGALIVKLLIDLL